MSAGARRSVNTIYPAFISHPKETNTTHQLKHIISEWTNFCQCSTLCSQWSLLVSITNVLPVIQGCWGGWGGCSVEHPSPSTYHLLRLVFQGVSALIRQLLEFSNLILFASADDLGFTQHTLNCGGTHKKQSGPALGLCSDGHTHERALMFIDGLSVNQYL